MFDQHKISDIAELHTVATTQQLFNLKINISSSQLGLCNTNAILYYKSMLLVKTNVNWNMWEEAHCLLLGNLSLPLKAFNLVLLCTRRIVYHVIFFRQCYIFHLILYGIQSFTALWKIQHSFFFDILPHNICYCYITSRSRISLLLQETEGKAQGQVLITMISYECL